MPIFDKIITADQMFEALNQIAKNHEFFGLPTYKVWFEKEYAMKDSDNIIEFCQSISNNFKTEKEILQHKQKLNNCQQEIDNLKNQLAEIGKNIGAKIESETDYCSLRDELLEAKKNLLKEPGVKEKVGELMNDERFNPVQSNEERKFNTENDYILNHVLDRKSVV